jgi:hypothetical protein
MSSIGLGNNKKGSRVADSSMMTRNIRQVAAARNVASELSTISAGFGVIPRFRVPSAETIQTTYKSLTPADMNSFNSAEQAAKNIHS